MSNRVVYRLEYCTLLSQPWRQDRIAEATASANSALFFTSRVGKSYALDGMFHGAKLQLASAGRESTDTVPALLFKLSHSNVSISKHCIIVVDEAGMISNDDCRKFLT